jgi:hypothetical protein
VVASSSPPGQISKYWPSARHFTEVIQCPAVCFAHTALRRTLPAVDRLGMPIVTSGQFAYVYKLKSMNGDGDFAVRCFRGYLGDRDQRYRAIQEHVLNSPIPYLSEFSYAPEGIMVGNQRFPILFMNWIEGPTLDLYVNEMIERREVLAHLAEEWLRVISTLQQSGVAHGDLQHGNVIVEHGQLRLIDHDGIFVPAMKGWSACEVGHQHYQHPQRTAHQFDANLDNFSALVIYLSLLSLAEKPGLWKEYHDENLLFTKADFLDPSSSTLFARIKEIGPEHRRLAEVLADGAKASPDSFPHLLDLVHSVSRLPSWMKAPLDLESTTKTREVERKDAPVDTRNARWMTWQERHKDRSMPATPQSPTFQTIFSGGTVPPPPKARNPDAIAQNTVHYAKDLFRGGFVWWWWALFLLFQFGGTFAILDLMVALMIVALVCVVYGLFRALQESHAARQLKAASQSGSLPLPGAPTAPQRTTLLPPTPLPQRSPAATKPLVPLMGNRVLGIFHEHDSPWVHQISAANLVNFASASEASSNGYKACRVCLPGI